MLARRQAGKAMSPLRKRAAKTIAQKTKLREKSCACRGPPLAGVFQTRIEERDRRHPRAADDHQER